MNNKKIIITGAGIAGLSTGYYASMNGYETEIYEMHDKPGGICTSWKRKGYIFDYCIHNLAGTGEKSGLRKVWDELGAFEDKDIIDHEMFVRIEGPEQQPWAVTWSNNFAKRTANGLKPKNCIVN